MNAQEFAKELGIKQEGSYIDGVYVINLKDSNEYSKVYTILDKSNLCDLDVEEISLDVQNSLLVYLADNFDIKLQANFDNTVYSVSFEEVKEDGK